MSSGWLGMPWLRLVAGTLAAVGAACLAAAFTFSLAEAAPVPELALSAWRTSTAQSSLAARLVLAPFTGARLAQAELLARAALSGSPVNVEAARALALAEAGQEHLGAARRMIRYAEQLSRRDVQTEFWLIQERVAAADVPGALLHYHRAMQTSRASRELLSPILAQAAEEPAVYRPLAQILAQRPEWWPNFLGDFVERTHSPAALTVVTRSLRLNPAVPAERDRLTTILQRYVTLGEVASGRRLFDSLTGEAAAPVAQGGFERDTMLAPYGWQIGNGANGGGARELRQGARGAFALTLDGSRGEEAAHQILALSPGRHELRLLMGDVLPGFFDPATITLRCFPADTPIAEHDLPVTRGTAALRVPFMVPEGCPAQILIVRDARSANDTAEKPWIDDVTIVPLPGGSHSQ